MGCESEASSVKEHLTVGSIRIWRCPQALWKEMPEADKVLINEVFFYHGHWLKGHLPKDGGVDSQDKFLMRCFPVIEKWIRYHERTGK
jgi:hypothetical protein